MYGRTLEEGSAIRSLSRKKDVRFNFKTRTIEIIDQRRGKNPAQDLGNKSWGLIDFLVDQGWRKEFVSEFRKENIVIW